MYCCTGENKLNGLGILSDITAIDTPDAVPDILVQQVQAGRGGGSRLPRHVRGILGAGYPHRAQRLLPSQRAHVQARRAPALGVGYRCFA